MISKNVPTLREYRLEELSIEDEDSFRHVAIYGDLKQTLINSEYWFRVLPSELEGQWDAANLLNLTFWGANEGGDVLVSPELPADVIAHAAWHQLANRAIAAPSDRAPTAAALFLGEAIASGFDIYLVGRLLGHSPDSTFLESQVLAMADAAESAGLSANQFEDLLESVADNPDLAFAELRELLFDATTALYQADSPDSAIAVLDAFAEHRFAPLLHHYELSNWVLYARAYARPMAEVEQRVEAIDRALREAAVALEWLSSEWVRPIR